MAIIENGSVNAVVQSGQDNISDIRSALETASAKVNSTVGALAILAGDAGDDAPLFFTLMNALQPADAALECIVDRLMLLERPAGELQFLSPADLIFAAKLTAFTGYDAAVKALPRNASDAEIELADSNRFDALAELMHATPQTARGTAALLRAIIGRQSDFLSGNTPTDQAIRAGLANVLAAVERLASEGGES